MDLKGSDYLLQILQNLIHSLFPSTLPFLFNWQKHNTMQGSTTATWKENALRQVLFQPYGVVLDSDMTQKAEGLDTPSQKQSQRKSKPLKQTRHLPTGKCGAGGMTWLSVLCTNLISSISSYAVTYAKSFCFSHPPHMLALFTSLQEFPFPLPLGFFAFI